jgi:polyisoprenyl-phosphate glycosyltransferase
MSLISIIIPVFNEEANVRRAYQNVVNEFLVMQKEYDVEFIFADNHSTDQTFEILKDIAKADMRVKVIRYNRNYGFQRSLLTAYLHASGDAAIQIDCDLQDPTSLFPKFLQLWEEGHDVVVGVRRTRQENKLLTWCRRCFYAFLDGISEDNIMRNAGDFRLIDRAILNILHHINDHTPYVRGLISSLATNETAVPYDRERRLHGKSKFPVRKLVGFALNGILGHSTIPLRLATYLGITISVVTLFLSSSYILGALLFGETWPSGFATIAILILFGISLNSIFLGVLGEYIRRIYLQIQQRPLTVIEQIINIPEKEAER